MGNEHQRARSEIVLDLGRNFRGWTFAVLVLKQSDLADLVGAAVRFIVTTMFFYWLLDHGPDLATKIMQSTQQMGNDASGSNGVDYNAFLNTGKDILLGIMGKVNILQPVTATCALVLGLLILIFLCLITLNIMLVTAQTWIIAYAGLIFLAFGASEWTRDMAVGYYKTMLAFGVKLMLTLLLAAIGLDILRGAQIQIGQGIDLVVIIKAMGGSLILLGIVAKAPDCVASIAGVSTGGFGHGIGTFLAAAGMGYQAGGCVGRCGSRR